MWKWLKEEWVQIGEKTKIFLVFGMLVILVLLGALVWTFLSGGGDGPASARRATEAEKPPAISIEEVLGNSGIVPAMGPNERRILERHFQAVGGVDRIASINSVVAMGNIIPAEGSPQPVVLVKKTGQKLRVTVKGPGGQVVMAVTPESNWRAYYRNGKLESVDTLKEEDILRMKRSAYVVSELFLAMQNEWTVQYLGQKSFNYKMAHCFEVKLDRKGLVRFFIDPETFLDTGREDWYYDDAGTLTIIRVLSFDHVDIAGLKVPSRIESYEDNVHKQTFLATDVEVNPGILDSSFARPELIEAKAAATP